MAISENAVFLGISVLVLLAALGMQITGVATHYWLTIDWGVLGSSSTGLWIGCRTSFETTTCVSKNEITKELGLPLADWFNAVRGLSVLGILFLVAAMVLTVLCIFLFERSRKKIFLTISLVLCFVAGMCIIVSVAWFGSKADTIRGGKFGWSFILSIIGGVMSILTGVLQGIAMKRSSDSTNSRSFIT